MLTGIRDSGRMCLGRFLVQTRWPPQIVVGSTGTPATWAIFTAPGLELLELEGAGHRRLGEDADDLAGPQRPDGGGERLAALVAVDGDVLHAAHQRSGHAVAEDRLLGHEAHVPPVRPGRQPGVHEVEVGRGLIAMTAPPTFGTCSSPVIVKRVPWTKKRVLTAEMTGRYTGSFMSSP